MKTRETIKEVKKNLFKKAYVEELGEPDSSPKAAVRHKINNNVFDIEDSVADNAKWLSLLTTLLSRFYDTFTETQKARFSAEDRAMIEGFFERFSQTETRGDVQFAKEGEAMLAKILKRQKEVADIIKKEGV